jgi:tyrosine-specific transport protein
LLPLGFALLYPHVFLSALGFAGGFGCATLLGVMPIIMVWKAKIKVFPQKVYVLLLAFVVFEMIIELYNLYERL